MSRFAEQENMVRLLALGRPPSEVAESLGVTPATVYARLRMPLFKALVAEARGKLIEEHASKATDMIGCALDVLKDVMDSDETDAKTRVSAATAAVSLAVKLRQESLLYPRLAALEAAVEEAGIDIPTVDDFAPSHTEAGGE